MTNSIVSIEEKQDEAPPTEIRSLLVRLSEQEERLDQMKKDLEELKRTDRQRRLWGK